MIAILEFKAMLHDVAKNTQMPEECYQKVLMALKNQIESDRIKNNKKGREK